MITIFGGPFSCANAGAVKQQAQRASPILLMLKRRSHSGIRAVLIVFVIWIRGGEFLMGAAAGKARLNNCPTRPRADLNLPFVSFVLIIAPLFCFVWLFGLSLR